MDQQEKQQIKMGVQHYQETLGYRLGCMSTISHKDIKKQDRATPTDRIICTHRLTFRTLLSDDEVLFYQQWPDEEASPIRYIAPRF